jgi:hypothetical protein
MMVQGGMADADVVFVPSVPTMHDAPPAPTMHDAPAAPWDDDAPPAPTMRDAPPAPWDDEDKDAMDTSEPMDCEPDDIASAIAAVMAPGTYSTFQPAAAAYAVPAPASKAKLMSTLVTEKEIRDAVKQAHASGLSDVFIGPNRIVGIELKLNGSIKTYWTVWYVNGADLCGIHLYYIPTKDRFKMSKGGNMFGHMWVQGKQDSSTDPTPVDYSFALQAIQQFAALFPAEAHHLRQMMSGQARRYLYLYDCRGML